MAIVVYFVAFLVFRVAAVLGVFVVGAIIESVMGRIDSAPNKQGLILNCFHVAVFHGADLSFGAAITVCIDVMVNRLPYRAPIQWHGGPLRLALLSCAALATHDLFYYWLHRFQHSSKWLWAQHELHHSDEHMNVTTSARFHWTETILQPIFIVLPVLLIFRNPSVGTVLWLILFSKAMVYFVHLNAPIRFGVINYLFSSPQSHRIHHSTHPEHFDKNFATILPLWDIIFGTYYHPKEEEWPSTGVEGVKITSLWQAVALPFVTWGSMLRPSERVLRQNGVAD